MKNFLTRETTWILAGGTLLFTGAATALLAAPILSTIATNNAANDASNNALVRNAIAANATTGGGATDKAISQASPRTSTRTVVKNVAWTTYKGNAQRTGASNVRIALPLGLEWRYSSEADPGPITGSPIVTNTSVGRVVIFNAARNVFALDSESGEWLWGAENTSSFRAPLTLLPDTRGNMVLTTTTSGLIQALRASDGEKIWSFKAVSPVSVAPILAQTAKGTRIIVATNDGQLIALTTAGVLDASWKVTLGQSTQPAATPSLTADGKRLLISGRDGYLYAIDLRTSRVVQATNLGVVSPMSAIDTGTLIVTGAGNTAIGIRADNNSVVWRTPIESDDILSVSLSGDIAYFATRKGNVLALRTRNGQQVWKTNVGRTSLSGSPLVLPNAILVGGRDSILYALDRATGKVTWRYRVDTERSVPIPKVASASSTPGAPTSGVPFNPYNPAGNTLSSPSTTATTGITVATPTPTPIVNYELRTYGISSAPSIVDGQLFVAADNAALYSFSTSLFDGAPPNVARSIIVVPTKEGGEFSVALTPTLPGIPLRGPIAVEVQLKDEGSGIDPARISANFDGQPVKASDMDFNVSSSVLRVLVQKYQRGESNELSDGTHTLSVEATDYSGNTVRNSQTFTASAKFLSPSVSRLMAAATPTPTPAPAPPTWRGGNWDPRNGPPPWAGRRGRNRGNNEN